MDNQFKIFGELDLAKSCQGNEDNQDHWYLQGMILTDDTDVQGETPVLKSMDWSYFDNQGFLKYEHDVSGPTPKTIIGVPHIRKSLPHGEWLRAKLLPRPKDELEKGNIPVDYARETVALIKAIQEHNKEHPEKSRTIGFSIEGQYLKKSSDGKYAGKVINVVVSPNPIGIKTYAEMAKSYNSAEIQKLHKALSTGIAISPDTQTGGGALRKESLNKDVISQTFDDNTKGVKTMKDFKNKNEAKDYYMGEEGLSEEDALKKAGELFPDKKEKEEDDVNFEEVGKSIQANTNKLDELIGVMKKSHVESPDFEAIGNDDEVLDITPVFENMQKSVTALHEQQETLNDSLSKSLTEISNGFKGLNDLIKSMATKQVSLEQKLEQSDKVIKAMAKSAGDISFLNLSDEKIIDPEVVKKSITDRVKIENALFKALESGKISGQQIARWNVNYELTPDLKAVIEEANVVG